MDRILAHICKKWVFHLSTPFPLFSESQEKESLYSNVFLLRWIRLQKHAQDDFHNWNRPPQSCAWNNCCPSKVGHYHWKSLRKNLASRSLTQICHRRKRAPVHRQHMYKSLFLCYSIIYRKKAFLYLFASIQYTVQESEPFSILLQTSQFCFVSVTNPLYI